MRQELGHGYRTRLKPDIWRNARIASMNTRLLQDILLGLWGPIDDEERAACEFWLAMKRLEEASQ